MRTIEDAYKDFSVDRMTDPMRRYACTEMDVFIAGWKAASRKTTGVEESLVVLSEDSE